MSKVYVIVGVNSEGHLESAGGFFHKADAYHDPFPPHLTKVSVLPITLKAPSHEVTEATGRLQPSSELVAKGL